MKIDEFFTGLTVTGILLSSLLSFMNIAPAYGAGTEYFWGYGAYYASEEGWDKVKSDIPTTVNLKPFQGEEADFDNKTYPWTVNVMTVDNSGKEDLVSCSYGSVNFNETSGSSISEVKLSTKAFSTQKILRVEVQYKVSIPQSYSCDVKNGTSQFNNSQNLGSLTDIFAGEDLNTQADELEITFTNRLPDRNVSLSINQIRITYTGGRKLEEARLSLPKNNNYQWQPVIDWEGQLFNTSVGKENFEVIVTPLFDTEKAAEPEIKGITSQADVENDYMATTPGDGYYTFEPYAILAEGGGMSLNVPCSGVYEVTLSTKEGAQGVVPATVSRTYNIHCSYQGLSINNVSVPTDETPLKLGIYNIDSPILLSLDADNAEVWYNVGKAVESTVISDLTDTDTEPIPAIPDNFRRYDATGLPLKGNDYLEIYIKKNGSISPVKHISYELILNPVGVEKIGEEIIEQGDKCQYYNLEGLAIPREALTTGIFIERNTRTGKYRKIFRQR